jgi:putative transposase
VFVTKYRRKAFTNELLFDMENIFNEVCVELGCIMHEFNGEVDYVHFLCQMPPTIAPTTLVKRIKGKNSRLIRQRYQVELRRLLWGGNLWSPSVCVVSCGGATIETIKSYIEGQDLPA